MNTDLDAIVIGAGHAGLSISYHLKKLQLNYLIFEKNKIGSTWQNQRWDSFRLNTPNSVNILPGQENSFTDEEGFCSAPEFVSFLKNYAEVNGLQVQENSEVISVIHKGGVFEVCAYLNGSYNYVHSKQVIVASGGQNKKIVPTFANKISPAVFQLHSGDYKNASLLPNGAVLVVGCAQSGIQIAEDLLASGRKVYVSTCQVGRMPRRYRGRDTLNWIFPMGMFDTFTESVTDPKVLKVRQPHISGVGFRGHTISLQSLAKSGAVILGKISDADQSIINIQPNAVDNIRFADEISRKTKEIIDLYILKSNISSPPAEEDPADMPYKEDIIISETSFLDLTENNISSLIWATGFTGDFSYLNLPVFDENGSLVHVNGLSIVEGIYFIGLPWMRRRKSGIVYGIRDDAEFIAGKIEAYHKLHKGIPI